MNFINFEEFQKTDSYEKFKEENPSTGTLKVEVFTAYQAIPIPETRILVTKDIDDKTVLFFSGVTDSSGMISNIVLPSPMEDKDFEPGDVPAFTTYDVVAIHEGYERIKKYDVSIFGDTGVIQYIKMIPDTFEKGTMSSGS